MYSGLYTSCLFHLCLSSPICKTQAFLFFCSPLPSAHCDLTSADAQAHGDPFPVELPLAGGLFLQCGITRDFNNKVLGAGLAGSVSSISVVLATALTYSYSNACLDS